MITDAHRPAPGGVGVMGGTFDPVHLAHLRLAEELAAALDLAEVRFVPAGQPPHRNAPQAGAAHRLTMTRLAVAGNPRFGVDAREVERDGPSYMVDTLASLRVELGPDTPLWLMVGGDAFLGLPRWHRWRDLFALANVAVAARPGSGTLHLDDLPAELAGEVAPRLEQSGPAGAVRLLPMTPLGIASTAIRAACAAGASVRYLVPDAVHHYLNEHKLYSKA